MSAVDVPPSGRPSPEPGAANGSPPGSGPSDLGRIALLVGVVTVLVAVATWAGQGDLVLVIACLIVMIMVHELGHLLAAKRGRMQVTEYFLGFGPRLWSVRRGETEYGIKAVPLGGYVKIPGMTNLDVVDPADEHRTYRAQPFGARLAVALAGSTMHFLMAFVLLWALLVFIGHPDTSRTSIERTAALGGRPGPAQVAGLRPGDVVVSADGAPVGADAGPLVAAIRSHPGTPVTLVVLRDGVRRTVAVTPVDGRTVARSGTGAPAGGRPYGLIGVGLGAPVVRTGPLAAVPRTFTDLGRFSWAAVAGVAHLFSPSAALARFSQVTDARAASQAAADGTRVQSVVGAVQTAQQAAHAGVADLLLVLISINLFVGIFNLFPMLPLDGGHVAIACYERVRSIGRRERYQADVAKLLPLTWAMVGFLGILFATSFLTDVLHPMANPFG